MLGWLVERVTRGSVAAYTARCLWEPLGAEADGFYIMDGAPGIGREFSGAGFNATLRDFGRFGQMMLQRRRGRRATHRVRRLGAGSRRSPIGPEDNRRGGYGLQWWTLGGSDLFAPSACRGSTYSSIRPHAPWS